MPPAPGRFSMTNCCLSCWLDLSATSRMVRSPTPPAPYGTNTRTGLVGYALAAWPETAATAARTAAHSIGMTGQRRRRRTAESQSSAGRSSMEGSRPLRCFWGICFSRCHFVVAGLIERRPGTLRRGEWRDCCHNPRRGGRWPIELLRAIISFCYTDPPHQACREARPGACESGKMHGSA